jgi:hypothetical protein
MEYKIFNGISYHEETSQKVIDALERARQNGTRIMIDYGDVKTGDSWGEVCDIYGYVGMSNGERKVPLLIHNSRSFGGVAILTHCIIGIYESKGKRCLYKIK